ncbi:GNAT family N-acetyltransferase [Streptomyces sp. UNOC14_S4]|uniref:GNAT family N-acetyltransferase n=1 Tax=Streptomyces sp. UNOC14_S4 TaxID=2872340 RepID=UPI001E38182E|nr:GNAT family N-acetyltransferase [Streptomyces sp. UNOC14_S4]MCC3766747.1 GNAT family N-acetyltransferase [Streptomyces sp. UNOC14_S4]
MNDTVRIRPIGEDDWEAIAALESAAYAGLGLSEGEAALRSRCAASPGTCFALDVGSRLAGYLLTLPYPAFRFPDLERPEPSARPDAPDTRNLHLHDIVVTRRLRRRGLARHLLRHLTLTARSRGYERISLVSVGDNEEFWSARGFTRHPEVVPPGSYGTQAVYMSKPVRSE